MNVAFPAALFFALLLPGFLLRTQFKSPERTAPDPTPFGRAAATSAGLALILNALWVWLSSALTPYHADWQALLLLLSADRGTAFEAAVSRVARFPVGPFYYCASLCAFAYVLGLMGRALVARLGLDREGGGWLSSVLRADTPWYYLFNGHDSLPRPDGVVIAAIVETEGSTQLFVGLLAEYFLTTDGQIDRLVLRGVSRRPFNAGNTPDEAGEAPFYAIEGDYFVLRGQEIKTLNVRYLRIDSEEDRATCPPQVHTAPGASAGGSLVAPQVEGGR